MLKMEQTVIYLKGMQSILAKHPIVMVKDMVTVYCRDFDKKYTTENLEVFHFEEGENAQKIISVVKLIELIQKKIPEAEVENLGATDFVVSYKKPVKKSRLIQSLKVIFVCLVAFFGGGYAIMAYNIDVSTNTLFSDLTKLCLGEAASEPSIIALAYSIGLVVGMVVFFNHGMGKKLNSDPTPLQVQMRLYEDDVNTSMIKDAERKGENLDANR